MLTATAIKTTKKSYLVMNEGGLDMWDKLKSTAISTVRVGTDDMEIALGLLIKQTLKTVLVATLTPTRQGSIETQETGRRYRCEVLSIERSRLTDFATLN